MAKKRYELFLLREWINYAGLKAEKNELQSVDFEAFEETRSFTNIAMTGHFTTSYVFCMSECRDDLGQWRGYADDGCGISIGFNVKLFHVLSSAYTRVTSDLNFNFNKVEYGTKSADKLFATYSKEMKIATEMTTEEVLTRLGNACVLTMELAPTVKNDSFKQEKEWRLIYNIDDEEIKEGKMPSLPQCLSDYSDKLSITGLSYVTKKGNLVGHLNMVFPRMKDMISEIVIGPKCSATKDDILMFLISEGIVKNETENKIKICKSESSYI